MDVLVTGGAGYIGSTIATALERAGHRPVLLDSLVKGHRAFTRGRAFHQGDIGDIPFVTGVLDAYDVGAVIHCAALTVVPESVREPARYWRENVAKTLTLLEVVLARGVDRVVFSSSGSVYAVADDFEVREGDPLGPASPYSRTKVVVEQLLADLAGAGLRSLSLRYFNPIGADPSLASGPYETDPAGVLNRLVLATADRPFTITGTDFPTRDGTGLRDYVHVWDVALAHVAALDRFDEVVDGAAVLNVGTGTGTTVRELVASVERVTGRPVPTVETPRRPGDAAGWYANVDRVGEVLGWRAASSLDHAVASALAWADVRAEVLGG